MRFGLDKLPDGRSSAVRQLVDAYMHRSRRTVTQVAQITGLSRNTVLSLGERATRSQSIDKLARLGIPRAELERAEAIDMQRRSGLVFPEDVYDVVIAAMELTPEERQLLVSFAELIRNRRAV